MYEDELHDESEQTLSRQAWAKKGTVVFHLRTYTGHLPREFLKCVKCTPFISLLRSLSHNQVLCMED